MSFFSEEQQFEMRELFFETASELLQALNEQGLRLEQNPQDAELVREVRRTVHTLKGDSAACGFEELSSLAHQLEDVLTPEIAASSKGKLVEAVLTAADIFAALITRYREGTQPPTAATLRAVVTVRERIRELVANPEPRHIVPYKLTGRFAWTEYEQIAIERELSKGQVVYNIALAIDPNCPMKAAAVQLVKNALGQFGNVLAAFPEASSLSEQIDVLEFALASSAPVESIEGKCRIPSIISNVLVERASLNRNQETGQGIEASSSDETDVFGVSEQDSDTAPEENAASAASTSLTNAKLRVDAERIDDVLNLVGELVIAKSMLMQATGEFEKRFVKDPLRTKFSDAMAFQARVLNDLQKSVMKIRMVPVEQLFRRFPRLVRDVAKTCGKDVVLQVSGQETDLDKSILDALSEPLSHLLRNAVDHGIETPEERIAAGKPAQGTIKLNAFHQGNQIVIECSDDGGGIDRFRLVTKAVERGVLSHEEAERLSDTDALDLIFHPGLSTAEQITEISGRGMGMDIVKSVIERLKGSVSIDSRAGSGTSFLLKVPLTLAIIKALMFRVSDRLYAVPLASVLEIARASSADVHRVDQHEVMQLRDQVLTLVRMNQLVKRGPVPVSKKIFIVVVGIGDRRFGLIVDRLVGEEELVIKALDNEIAATELVSGASILGDGSVVLILNLSAVVARLGRAPLAMEAVTA
ncbi:MAG TPA: chemotaxis protein CheA [Terriglobales bacterium]|nr:chemotaxis protein CheA [Terriglobales bacterium]